MHAEVFAEVFAEVRTKDVELGYGSPGLLKKYGQEITLDSIIRIN